MSTHTLRPWTNLVKLHPDVEAGALTEAVFAIDLGAIAACLRAGTHRQAEGFRSWARTGSFRCPGRRWF